MEVSTFSKKKEGIRNKKKLKQPVTNNTNMIYFDRNSVAAR